MATLATFTGVNAAVVSELGNALKQAAAVGGMDNRTLGTCTLQDTGGVAPYIVSVVGVNGTTYTYRVG
jgi:hypothetical protein